MSIKNLEVFFNPSRIAVVGASEDPASIGYSILRNMIGKGFKGIVYPINPSSASVQGVEAYKAISDIRNPIDLAILTNPLEEIITTIEECGKKGVKGVCILCPDFESLAKDGKLLESRIRRLSLKYDLRVLGPDTLGFIRPGISLNASLFPKMPKSGTIAFISQSSTLATALLDRAVDKNFGFSYIISVGSKIDVAFSDLIDFLGVDPRTKAIILYLEHIKRGRKFLTAVRSYARSKPIVVVKSGKFEISAQVALTHSGFLAGEDKVYDAVFKRAGAVRVDEILDLFYLAETLAQERRPRGKKLAIVTNASAPSIIAVDTLLRMEGELAALSEETHAELRKRLPSVKEVKNPVNLLTNASPADYQAAVKICLSDGDVDGLLVIHVPNFGAQSRETAEAVFDARQDNPFVPIFTVWMGGGQVQSAREFLNNKAIPTFVTPEQAVRSFIYLHRYDYNLKLLQETPESILRDFAPDREKAQKIMKAALSENRMVLNIGEVKDVLNSYGIPLITKEVAEGEEETGVELFIGSRKDPSFGSVIVFGAGGDLIEAIGDYAVGLPPINQTLARRMMEETKIYKFLTSQPAYKNISRLLEEMLVRFSYLIIDFPCINEIDINPFFVTEKEGFARDAGILLEEIKEASECLGGGLCPPHLMICPYPFRYVRKIMLEEGISASMRPILPEDEPLIYEFFKGLSEETMRFRFNQRLVDMPHEWLARYCQVDYEREFAIVAAIEGAEREKIIADTRLMKQPDLETAELAVLVADEWQGRGIGTKLIDYCIGIAREFEIKTLWMEIMKTNSRMFHLAKGCGFKEVYSDKDMAKVELEIG